MWEVFEGFSLLIGIAACVYIAFIIIACILDA